MGFAKVVRLPEGNGMSFTCSTCGAVNTAKHPSLVASGKARAAKITIAQRKAWGAKGGKAKRKVKP